MHFNNKTVLVVRGDLCVQFGRFGQYSDHLAPYRCWKMASKFWPYFQVQCVWLEALHRVRVGWRSTMTSISSGHSYVLTRWPQLLQQWSVDSWAGPVGTQVSTKRKSSRVGWLVGFLTSSSTSRLYRGRAPRQSVWQFNVLPHMRQSWETMTSVSAGHIILTPTKPVGSGRPQRESNPGPPHQESRALPQSYRAPQGPLV